MALTTIDKTINKKPLIKNNLRLLQRLYSPYILLCIFLGTGLIIWLVFYCISPYWYARDFIEQLTENNINTAQHLIPKNLLQPYQSNASTLQHKTNHWHGAGGKYLQQVWPKVAQQQNMHQLVLLQFNSAPTDTLQRGYTDFPSTFRVSLGKPDNRLWFEWKRDSWTTWHLSGLCVYNPQPFSDVNTCASSSR